MKRNKREDRQEKKKGRKAARKKRTSMLRNGAVLAAAAAVVGIIILYNYSADQTRQRGLEFGVELEAIQNDVKDIQTRFYSEKTKWEEGDMSRDQLLEFYDVHVERFQSAIDRYDGLVPPEIFEGSVSLLRLSSQAQLDSDTEYIKWIRDGDKTAMARSDALLQDALEYELLGLVEFYAAKTGTKVQDDTGEKFTEPQRDIAQKANQVAEHMIMECDEMFGQDAGPPAGDGNGTSAVTPIVPDPQWAACVAEAEEWRKGHLP